MLLFTNKTAIITGSGGGLGRQYALELAKRGCNIVVNDIGEFINGDPKNWKDTASLVVKEITDLGGRAIANHSNVLDADQIIEQTIKTFGLCDVIVNNAGILRDKSFHKMTKDEWKAVLNVHLQGSFEMCHSAWPHMQKQNYGRIVNIGSAAGLYGNFGQANYSSAKMGIIGLTNTLANEGLKYNIHVNCVVPMAESKMTQTVLPSNLLNLLDPAHVSPLVAYLAHESTTATGGVYEVGGGWYSKVRLQRSAGICLGKQNQPATLENIRDNFENITKFDENVVYPTHPTHTLRDIIESQENVLSVPIAQAITTPPSVVAAAAETVTSILSSSTTTEIELGKINKQMNIPSSSSVQFKSDAVFESLKLMMTTDRTRSFELATDIDCSVQFHINSSNDSGNSSSSSRSRSNSGNTTSAITNMEGMTTKKWLIDLRSSHTTTTTTTSSKSNHHHHPFVREVLATDGRSDVLVVCTDDTFMKLLSSTLTPEYAYFQGMLQVKGNPLLIVKVKKLIDISKEYI